MNGWAWQNQFFKLKFMPPSSLFLLTEFSTAFGPIVWICLLNKWPTIKIPLLTFVCSEGRIAPKNSEAKHLLILFINFWNLCKKDQLTKNQAQAPFQKLHPSKQYLQQLNQTLLHFNNWSNNPSKRGYTYQRSNTNNILRESTPSNFILVL